MKYKCSTQINKEPLIAVLNRRGVGDISNFLNPTVNNLLYPYLLDNIKIGAQLLLKHLYNNNKILLIVDCDQDGFTSAAMLYNYCRYLNKHLNIEVWVHTGKQHGLEDKIDSIENNPIFNLVILPDSSSNDYEYHKRLSQLGIDCLVLDHHEAEKYSPNAVVVNNQLSENYSNKDLSGAGVVYKFLQVLDDLTDNNYVDEFIDLAAVGLIGDMMNVNTLENRYIIKTGLKNIKNSCLKELINRQSFSIKDVDNITPTDIAFYITPLINAIIRVGRQSEKEILFQAFINGNEMVPKISRNKIVPGEFESIAEQNARNCVNARSRQNRQLDKALDSIEINIIKNGLQDNKIIFAVIDDNTIDSTLTGLLAMKVMAKYNKPVLLGRYGDDNCIKGSLRNNDKGELKDLRQFLLDSNLFEYAEGHANASGFSIKENNIEDFIDYANFKLKDVDFNEGVYDVDFVINTTSFSQLGELILELGRYPDLWGKGCEEPLILVENLELTNENVSICGSNNDTVRIITDSVTFIKFKAADLVEEIKNLKKFSITLVGTPNINNWMGNETPQLFIKDYELKNTLFEF